MRCNRSLKQFVRVAVIATLPLFGVAAAPVDRSAEPALAYQVTEGRNSNALFREGPVAAHLLLRSGPDPRILVAFPAGNSGVGLWFARSDRPLAWTLTSPPRSFSANDPHGRLLRGIVAEAVVDSGRLDVRAAVLSSVRVLRDFERSGAAPAELLVRPRVEGNVLSWSRDRLDGAPGYRLSVEVLEGGSATPSALTGTKGKLRLRITALSGETPLHGLPLSQLLNEHANEDPRSRDVLAFLSYREKFLGGSWRFDTYFGRDTMLTTRLLMPVLQPQAVEAGIGAVLARLSPGGEVAHEEDIGEFAVLRHRAADGTLSDRPIYDYTMVDDDFMLPVLVQDWLLDDPRGRTRAAAFLAEQGPDGKPRGGALVRNFRFVVARTAAFAADLRASRLIGLKDERLAGQWRDSDEGLARGRYPYDVNAVWVPAALRAIDRLLKAGLLTAYLPSDARAELERAGAYAAVWQAKAPPLFAVTLPHEQAATRIAAYAKALGVPDAAALSAIGEGPIRFDALSLDARGQPLPVIHSDGSFLLLFGQPDAAAVAQAVTAMARPFPAGLMTDAGLLVANPVFADPPTQRRLDSSAYHGTVIWSWQQALFAAGLERQLQRTDLPAEVRALLADARTRLWQAIKASDAVRTSELWSWSYADGRYQVAPFGARRSDEDESNAAQLWSTAFLALRAPQTAVEEPGHPATARGPND